MEVKLIMFKADGKRKDFPVVNSSVVIGRGENCDLRVPLSSVSRKHCELNISGGTIKVRDLSSSNGTYVNNKRITEQDIHAGDRIVVGPVVFTVQVDGEPAEVLPVKTKGQKLVESSLMGQAAPDSTDAEQKEETGVPIAADAEDDGDGLASLESLVAEALKEDEEEDKEGTAA